MFDIKGELPASQFVTCSRSDTLRVDSQPDVGKKRLAGGCCRAVRVCQVDGLTAKLLKSRVDPSGGNDNVHYCVSGRAQFSVISTRANGPIPHDSLFAAVGGGSESDVTSSIDRAVIDARWRNDSTILVRVIEGFRKRICRITPNSAPVSINLTRSASHLMPHEKVRWPLWDRL